MKLSGQPAARRAPSISATISYCRRPAPHRRTERRVGVVGERCGAVHRIDLGRKLVHEQLVEERGPVFEYEAAVIANERARQQAPWRRGHAGLAKEHKPRGDRAADVPVGAHHRARHFCLGALGFGRAVEMELRRAVGGHDRHTVPFQDAEVRGIAQIVALPGIAVGTIASMPRAAIAAASRARRACASAIMLGVLPYT